MKPLRVIPFVMVDAERAMFITTRRWKPEPYWCGHGRRTWLVPLPSDPSYGRRFHGEQESFGAVLEVAGCDSTVRLRRGTECLCGHPFSAEFKREQCAKARGC